MLKAVYDPVYVAKREALIPEAARYADDAFGIKSERDRPGAWAAVFCNRMQHLTEREGLTLGVGRRG